MKLNKDKSSITGIGNWSGKNTWPVTWLKTSIALKILGIYYCDNIRDTVIKNWETVLNKVIKAINMLSNRYLTIYQKAIIVNSILLSRVWYLAHSFPLNKSYAQKINSHIFRYLWKGMYQPIRRNTLHLPKKEGGLGIISVYHKAAAILCNTCLKQVLKGNNLTLYYCQIRLSYLVDSRECKEVSYFTPVFYSEVIESMRKVHKHVKFPVMKSKDVYSTLFVKSVQLVVNIYP